ncbi:hypothetical protein QBC44DRAFT_111948 [Cladorrhinum sp. PSN332]|nr:hypothetical protein QBC44DRAFT_111948 [Cladorrhinum sp. PSN332]
MRAFILTAVLYAASAAAGPCKRDSTDEDALTTTLTGSIIAEPTSTTELSTATLVATTSAASPTATINDVCVLIPGDDEHEPLIIDSKVCACKCFIHTCKTHTTNEADYRFCLEKRDWWRAQLSELPYWWYALGTMGGCTGSHACSRAPDNDWTLRG